MAKASEIRVQLARLLANQISLREFSEWFVPYTWNIHIEEPETEEFAEAIDDELVQFGGDCGELRAALKAVQDSFGSPVKNVEKEVVIGNLVSSGTVIKVQGRAEAQILQREQSKKVFEREQLRSGSIQSNAVPRTLELVLG